MKGIQSKPSTTSTATLTWLILVASIGNTLGAVVNYAMGRGIERFRHRRWFPANAAQIARAQGWYARWGVWTLLLSWAPLGDAFTVIAGVMRTPVWLFVVLVTIAKVGRYLVLIGVIDVEPVEPFKIDKSAYGNMDDWLTVEAIERVRLA